MGLKQSVANYRDNPVLTLSILAIQEIITSIDYKVENQKFGHRLTEQMQNIVKDAGKHSKNLTFGDTAPA